MLKECKKASVFNLDHQYIADVKAEVVDKEYVLLIFPEELIDQMKTEVEIVFYDGQLGLVTCLCHLAPYQDDAHEKLPFHYAAMCQIKEQKGIIQRRADVKVKIAFPLEIFIRDAQRKRVKVEVETVDISAGGIAFATKHPLQVNQQFEFTFSRGEHPVQIKGQVLRATEGEHEEPAMKEGVKKYGCRFLDMNLYKETVVRKFVFKEQLRRYRVKYLD